MLPHPGHKRGTTSEIALPCGTWEVAGRSRSYSIVSTEPAYITLLSSVPSGMPAGMPNTTDSTLSVSPQFGQGAMRSGNAYEFLARGTERPSRCSVSSTRPRLD
jgi:hypothetical protein